MLRPVHAVLALALLPLSPAAAQKGTITPGGSIGRTRLGESRAALRQRFGKPSRSSATHLGCTLDQWDDSRDGSQFEAVYQSGRVVQLKTSADRFATGKGLSTASNYARIRRVYPRLKITNYQRDTETGKGFDYCDDVRGGIAFVFATPTTLDRNREKPWLILVHRRGHAAIPTEVPDPSNIGILTPDPQKRPPGAASIGPKEASCRAFVRRFYAWYVPFAQKEHQEPSCDLALKQRASSFSREIRRRMAEDSAAQAKVRDLIVGIDFDPFLNAQDFADRYLVQKVSRHGDRYRVEVYGIWNGKRSSMPDVVPELVPSGRGWMFVNFIYPPHEGETATNDLLGVLKSLREDRAKDNR
jgi:hypothetical protein